jgi:hypothetical protein
MSAITLPLRWAYVRRDQMKLTLYISHFFWCHGKGSNEQGSNEQRSNFVVSNDQGSNGQGSNDFITLVPTARRRR